MTTLSNQASSPGAAQAAPGLPDDEFDHYFLIDDIDEGATEIGSFLRERGRRGLETQP